MQDDDFWEEDLSEGVSTNVDTPLGAESASEALEGDSDVFVSLDEFEASVGGSEASGEGVRLEGFLPAQWQVVFPQDGDGKVISGKDSRANPPVLSLMMKNELGEFFEQSIVLTPPVASRLSGAMDKVLKNYDGRNIVEKIPSAPDVKSRIFAWHKRHKFLATINILVALIVLVVGAIGLFTMFFIV